MGAGTRSVLRMILGESLKMTTIGAAIGLLLALPLPTIFGAIFYGLGLREPRLYFIVPLAIFAVAMLAAYIPARRATQVDPITALRQE
jgi:ABC-type antimicrobial peptide transport system permease subunit